MASEGRAIDISPVLDTLKDFQLKTVNYVFNRLYSSEEPVNRFLIADEVGLGKTLVARGIIAKVLERYWGSKDRIDILYICSNQDIARQNVNRLKTGFGQEMPFPTRITLMPTVVKDLEQNKVNFISLTPRTSFDLKSTGGRVEERALIYEILKRGWRLGNYAAPKNLFQGDVSRRRWSEELGYAATRYIDNALAEAYLRELNELPGIEKRFREFLGHFGKYRKYRNIPYDRRRRMLDLVGELRRVLAQSCLSALKPTVVILDEFQRFKYLLEKGNEAYELAGSLFGEPDVKTLLLSATPYKMYTLYDEEENHYEDFIRTLGFLLGSEQEKEEFEEELESYRLALLRFGTGDFETLRQARDKVEKTLRRVMVRTERTTATAAGDAMIWEPNNEDVRLESSDVRSFKLFDVIARGVGAQDMVEYWKSAPYLLNFMEAYKVKEKFVSMLGQGPCPDNWISEFMAKGAALLPWDTIEQYKEADPGNAKLRGLVNRTIGAGAWQLLWVPPSFPYYSVSKGPYSLPGIGRFTKALVFSSWKVVPKVISVLCSYEAERRMVKAFEVEASYSEERQKRKPLLRFAVSRGRLTGMSNLALLYPCMTLASQVDPLAICAGLADGSTPPRLENIMAETKRIVEGLLKPILEKYSDSSRGVDESWYWAALALLDREGYAGPMANWLGTDNEDLNWRLMVRSRDEESDTRFSDHVEEFFKYGSAEPSLIPPGLGRPPDDLMEVCSKIALASPAVVTLRSLRRFSEGTKLEDDGPYIFAAAARVAMAVRSMFNLPESITMVRSLSSTKDTRYWEAVLDYCVQGNLQSSMDEYFHILRESLGLYNVSPCEAFEQLSETVGKALSIRTVNLKYDEIVVNEASRKVDLEPRQVRCKFALRFGEDKDEVTGEKTRRDQVRAAFNSPFRPFILATTSIGQEGLDFHQYCHDVYHWNLPSNPVDLEQREGRINRYKGHALRRNVAKAFPLSLIGDGVSSRADVWELLFARAKESRGEEANDLVPYWIYEVPGGFKINRYIPALPLSRDEGALERLKSSLAVYRMVFGQPRQEDLLKYLLVRTTEENATAMKKYQINLAPD